MQSPIRRVYVIGNNDKTIESMKIQANKMYATRTRSFFRNKNAIW